MTSSTRRRRVEGGGRTGREGGGEGERERIASDFSEGS